MIQDYSLGRWLAEAALTRRWCDVTIQASGREYKAHRVVLSCASPFMRGLLLSLPNEDAPTTIVLADFSAETVEALLQYVYRGEVQLAPEHVEGFMALAKALQVHIDKRHIDGMHDRFQHLLINTSCQKCEISPTNYLMTTDLIVDKGATRDTSVDRKSEKESLNCLTQKDNSRSGLKNVNLNHNVDIEVLIKSDKISKKSVISLPLMKGSLLKPQEDDYASLKKFNQCFLKDILVSKGKVCGKNVPCENISMNSETKNIQILTPRKESKLIRDVNNFSKCKAGSLQHFLIENKDGSQIDKSDSFYEDNYSNTSYEISREENNREFDKSKTHIHASPQKGYCSFRDVNGYQEEPLNKLNCLNSSDSKIGQKSIVLNLVNNQRNVYRDSPFDLSKYSYKVPWNGFDRDQVNLDISERGFVRNNKLVRPIPSLMPIRDFDSVPDYRQREAQQEPQTLLDLTTFKSVHLVRNSKSAFDEVSTVPGLCEETSYSESFPKMNDGLPTRRVNSSHNQKSLRFGFSISVDEDTSDKSLNITQNSLQRTNNSGGSVPSDDYNHRRRIPNNKVLASPWSGRCPVYYRREDNKKITLKQVSSCSASIICPSPESVIKLATSEDTTAGLTSVRSIDCKNDSVKIDNRLDTNGAQNETECIGELQSDALYPTTRIHSPKERVIRDAKVGDYELTKILNGGGAKTTTHNTQKKTQNINEKILEDSLILPIIKVESAPAILSEDACALKCEVCSKMFTSRATLALHAGGHAARARYKCEQCDKCFSQLRNYKYHVSVHKGTKEFAATCNVCGKYFNDRGYLSSHMKIHRNRKEYQCPHCPKSFNQRVAYNMHVRIHTGVKPHQCSACGKAFSRKMLLKQHARTHSGEKPYSCEECGKRFADRSNMTLHMRLHSGVKPFSCTLCPKAFTKKHHLKTHLNYHTGNKPYSCCKCGLTFSQSSNMRTHMKKCLAPGPGSVEMTLDQRQTDQPR